MRGSRGSHTRSDAALAKAAQLNRVIDRVDGAVMALTSEAVRTEGGGQQLRKIVAAFRARLAVAADDESARREFVQHLAAGAARRRDRRLVGA